MTTYDVTATPHMHADNNEVLQYGACIVIFGQTRFRVHVWGTQSWPPNEGTAKQ